MLSCIILWVTSVHCLKPIQHLCLGADHAQLHHTLGHFRTLSQANSTSLPWRRPCSVASYSGSLPYTVSSQFNISALAQTMLSCIILWVTSVHCLKPIQHLCL